MSIKGSSWVSSSHPCAQAQGCSSGPSEAHADSRALRELFQRGRLTDLYAAREADAVAATALALACAAGAGGDRPWLWVRQENLTRETGMPYAPGLVEFGLAPENLVLVRASDARSALQAGLEGARCAALGAVIIELMGETRALDLTASRRLALAAKQAKTPIFLVRTGAEPQPSAAETRWHIRAAPSRALPANAPGNPVFSLTLLRHRGGLQSGAWYLEWNRDRRSFEERTARQILATPLSPTLPGRVAPLPANRPDHPSAWRKTG
ncbi:COG4544 Uncharacterized conserved protein [Rhabdaerophilaceae bacterium]